jgi:zinc transport system substrate-binding protein
VGTQYRWGYKLAGFALVLLLSGQLFADEPKLLVLTSVKPLQLIAEAVLGDIAQVDLLLDPKMSPHDYQLRPSDRRKLESADMMVWIGPAMETFLVPALSALPKRTKLVPLQVETAEAGDPHLWMDPLIGAAIGLKIADAASKLAPTYGHALNANAKRLKEDLVAEDHRLREQISSIKAPRGYMVVHDAYSRFESRYGIRHQAALTDIADLPPSAQQIARIQALFDVGEISCVIQEPFGSPKTLQALLRGRQVRVQTVDSLALKENNIVAFYRSVGASIAECLQP